MKWEELGYQWFVLANADGKILGEVKNGHRTWHATAGEPLGEYLTEKQAKRAVESKVNAEPEKARHD